MNQSSDIRVTIFCLLAMVLGVHLIHASTVVDSPPAVHTYEEVRTIITMPTTICDDVCLDSIDWSSVDYSQYLD